MMDRFRVTLARWAANVHALLVQGRAAGDIPADAIEVYQPQGLRAVPVPRAETEALVIELANGERLALVIDKRRDAGAVVPEAGETQVHCLAQPASVIRWRASGDIEVTPLAGRNVILAGGSTPVAKEGSATAGHTHAPGSLQVVIPSGPAAGTYPVTGATGSATDSIATGAGSPRVKVP